MAVALRVVTEMEIRYGLAKNPGRRIAPLIEEFLAGTISLPLTSDVAHHYAEIRAELEAKAPYRPLDLMIAAHARAVGATLVTTKLAEFRRVPGLRGVNWAG